jgi:hypothetical protein
MAMPTDIDERDIGAVRSRPMFAIGMSLLMWSFICDQPAEAATPAPRGMVGMSRERVLACMGAPDSSTSADGMEVLSYHTGSSASTSVDQVSSNVIHVDAPPSRLCKVDIGLVRGRVTKIQYNGSLSMAGKQCAYAIENCLSQKPGPAIYSVMQPATLPQTMGAAPPSSAQQHACTHEELVQARLAKVNGYTGGPNCN